MNKRAHLKRIAAQACLLVMLLMATHLSYTAAALYAAMTLAL